MVHFHKESLKNPEQRLFFKTQLIFIILLLILEKNNYYSRRINFFLTKYYQKFYFINISKNLMLYINM